MWCAPKMGVASAGWRDAKEGVEERESEGEGEGVDEGGWCGCGVGGFGRGRKRSGGGGGCSAVQCSAVRQRCRHARMEKVVAWDKHAAE